MPSETTGHIAYILDKIKKLEERVKELESMVRVEETKPSVFPPGVPVYLTFDETMETGGLCLQEQWISVFKLLQKEVEMNGPITAETINSWIESSQQ